jgi:hypothetical protein
VTSSANSANSANRLRVTGQGGKRGRPKGTARIVSEATGVHIRTVQRAIARGRPAPEESEADKTLRQFMTAFRNFATFCRENTPEDVGALTASEQRVAKVREWNAIVWPWLQRFNAADDEAPTS